MKVTIIMPTYNDCESICETLDSLMNQSFRSFELLIMDDGSKDNTKNVVEKYKSEKDIDNRIQYFYQDNQDQLNAICNLKPHITGDYVYILHSDDLLANEDVLQKCIDYMEVNKNLDAIIADLIKIDEKGNIIGKQNVNKYKNSEDILALQSLWLGRNLFVDFAFHTKESFLKNVANSYLTWNIPFWIQVNDDGIKMLNIENVNFNFIKYRVFEGNYINNPIGKLNVINGELRTLTTIMKEFNLPLYKTQYILYRIFNKLKINYKPLYKVEEQKNKSKIIKFVLKKRFGNEYKNNIFLNAVYKFYKSDSNNVYVINENIKNEFIYKGKDMRKFNNDLMQNKLSPFYLDFLSNMEQGFSTIEVEEENYKYIEDVCKFMCIYPFVKIEVKNKGV